MPVTQGEQNQLQAGPSNDTAGPSADTDQPQAGPSTEPQVEPDSTEDEQLRVCSSTNTELQQLRHGPSVEVQHCCSHCT